MSEAFADGRIKRCQICHCAYLLSYSGDICSVANIKDNAALEKSLAVSALGLPAGTTVMLSPNVFDTDSSGNILLTMKVQLNVKYAADFDQYVIHSQLSHLAGDCWSGPRCR